MGRLNPGSSPSEDSYRSFPNRPTSPLRDGLLRRVEVAFKAGAHGRSTEFEVAKEVYSILVAT